MGPVTDQGDREAIARWLASPAAAAALEAARAGGRRRTPRIPSRPAACCAAGCPTSTPRTRRRPSSRRPCRGWPRSATGSTGDLLLTRDGLEQGTRPDVADRRARMFAAAGARRVLDLTAGLGFDTAAFLAAGLARDGRRARSRGGEVPRPQLPGRHGRGRRRHRRRRSRRTAGPPRPTDIVFVDPARRDPAGPRDAASARSRPERDPERWSPPWSYVAVDRPSAHRRQGRPRLRPPHGWEAQWVSVDRTVVECSLASWPLSGVVAARSRHDAAATDGGGCRPARCRARVRRPSAPGCMSPTRPSRGRVRCPHSPRSRAWRASTRTAAGSPGRRRPAARPCAATSCWRSSSAAPGSSVGSSPTSRCRA